MKIDFHAHCYPPGFLQLLEERGAGIRIETTAASRRYIQQDGARVVTLTPEMEDLAPRLTLMDRLGFDIQVLSLTAPNLYPFATKDAALAARVANDGLARIRDEYPRRFRCLASVPLQDVGLAIAELDRALDALGMDGLIIGTNMRGLTWDDPQFAPFFARCDERGVTILLHPMKPMVGTEYMDRYALAPLVGFIFDTTLVVTRMIFDGFFDRYPRIKWVLPQAGAALPYIVGRLDIGWQAYPDCQKITRPPSRVLAGLFYDTMSLHPPALRCAADTVGVDRLVLGTDYPHVVGDPERNLRSLSEAGFSAEEQAQICSGNAIRLLGIRP